MRSPLSSWTVIHARTTVIKADCISARPARSFELSSAPPPSDMVDLNWLEPNKADSG